MTGRALRIEPWCLTEPALDLDHLAAHESVLALGNGHLGLRANLDEGEPYGVPGTYLNSVHELRPLPYAEAGYGYPESGQTVINVTNGKILRLLVDDEPFDVRYGRVHRHVRRLDLRAGTLTREVEWESPAGQRVEVTSVRMVSLTQRSIAAISYEVRAIDDPARIVVQSELVANEPQPPPDDDPRAAAVLAAPLVSEDHGCHDAAAVLVHRTKRSGLRVAAAMDHRVTGPDGTSVSSSSLPDVGRTTVATRLEPGECLSVRKVLAYGWSSVRSRQALRDQVTAAVTAAWHTGWDELFEEQRTYLDDFWERAEVAIEGDLELEQAIRLGLFHVLQAGARAEGRCIPAKGLTGPGYDGHAFWDTEIYVLPALCHTVPGAAADALRWRHSTLPSARERARTLGLAGAAYPWRTIAGEECSGYWPAGTAAFHVNADIAHAILHYLDVTGDAAFEEDVAVDVLVETARLWCALGHFDHHGRFRIAGVTGPDEYSAVADDNVYTNVMAQQNLRAAAEVVERHRAAAEGLGVTTQEAATWRAAAAQVFVPYDDDLGVHPQASGFTSHEPWDFDPARTGQPLFLQVPYFELYRRQVVKQADLVLALHLRPDCFTFEEKQRDFAYYEALTVRDSSLSAATQAVLAAEVGHLDLALDYIAESALVDLDDAHGNTAGGVHLAALAGAWAGVVAGLGGMRTGDGRLRFSPRLPSGLSGVRFSVGYRGRTICVAIGPQETTYRLVAGEEIEVGHHDVDVVLRPGAPVTEAQEPVRDVVPVSQPPGRAPARRHDGVPRAP